MNYHARLVILTLLFTFTVGTAWAANVKIGKEVFQTQCKSCHSASGKGGVLRPVEKTRGQWRRFFKKYQHPGKTGILENIGEEDMKSLRLFLDQSAADADHAETCG